MSENERWIRRRNGQVKVIVFLHGIGAGDPERYWQQFLNVLPSDQQMEEFDIFVWKYPTHIGAGLWKDFIGSLKKRTMIVSAPRIKLLGGVWGPTYQAQFRDYQEVVLVCHSMGGLVVKSWIIDVLESGQSSSLDKLRHISFYATPHNGAPVTTLASWNDQLKDMKLDSNFIEDVGRRWHDHVVAWKDKSRKTSDRPYNRYIPHLVITGINDGVVPYNLAAIRGMQTIPVQGDHSQVIRPENIDDTRYKIWRDDVEETLQVSP